MMTEYERLLFPFDLAILFASFVLVLLGLILSVMNRRAEPITKHYFIRFFAVMLVYMLASLVDQVAYYLAESQVWLVKGALFVESLVPSILLLMLTDFIFDCCGENARSSKLMKGVAALWAVYIILLVVTQFTPVFYGFDSDGSYFRGALYPLLLIPVILILLLDLAAVIGRRNRLSKRQRNAFLAYILLPAIAMLVQMKLYGLHLTVLATAGAALVMYLFLLEEQVDMNIRQAEEQARQEMEIRVLQMRPHFIYNTLTSIYYMCGESPEAQKLIYDFTTYLRKNFTAIARTEPIPFEIELEHTAAYLAVEKAQFEDLLFVEYDTPHTAFCLPPLTVQPMVENAVKHGMDPELDPLHITIRTQRLDAGSEVIIEDDGPGIDDEPNMREDVGIGNTRARLEQMCGGSLEISPREDRGTRVRIFVPDQISPSRTSAFSTPSE